LTSKKGVLREDLQRFQNQAKESNSWQNIIRELEQNDLQGKHARLVGRDGQQNKLTAPRIEFLKSISSRKPDAFAKEIANEAISDENLVGAKELWVGTEDKDEIAKQVLNFINNHKAKIS
jgi:hypothetical protein